eukprot:917215-Prymnesium_polylepis.1
MRQLRRGASPAVRSRMPPAHQHLTSPVRLGASLLLLQPVRGSSSGGVLRLDWQVHWLRVADRAQRARRGQQDDGAPRRAASRHARGGRPRAAAAARGGLSVWDRRVVHRVHEADAAQGVLAQRRPAGVSADG